MLTLRPERRGFSSGTPKNADCAWTSSWREMRMQEFSIDCIKIDFGEIQVHRPEEKGEKRADPLPTLQARTVSDVIATD